MESLPLTDSLLVYGPLGLLALLGIYATYKLFRLLKSERDVFADKLAELNQQHKTELQAMVDRYIKTTTSQVEQYHNLAEKLHTVLDAFRRRWDREA